MEPSRNRAADAHRVVPRARSPLPVASGARPPLVERADRRLHRRQHHPLLAQGKRGVEVPLEIAVGDEGRDARADGGVGGAGAVTGAERSAEIERLACGQQLDGDTWRTRRRISRALSAAPAPIEL